MSWTAARTYFRTKLVAKGFKEHVGSFDSQNIPETVLDKSFHLTFGPIAGNGVNQNALDSSFTVTIRTFYKGFASGPSAIDRAIQDNETLACDFLKPSNRLTGTIKNVTFSSLAIEPLSASNENSVVAVASYDVRTWLSVL